MHNLPLILICLHMLSSCAPAIVGVGAVGVSAASKNQTIGASLDETVLKARVQKAFSSSSARGVRDLYSKIYVTVQGHTVYLNGSLEKEEDIMKAVEIVWAQDGVRAVVNNLKVDENSDHFDLGQYTIDTGLTTSIKTQLLFTKDVKSANYTIITLENVVHIFGVARTQEELDIVTDIAAKIKGVDEVISHVKILSKENEE